MCAFANAFKVDCDNDGLNTTYSGSVHIETYIALKRRLSIVFLKWSKGLLEYGKGNFGKSGLAMTPTRDEWSHSDDIH